MTNEDIKAINRLDELDEMDTYFAFWQLLRDVQQKKRDVRVLYEAIKKCDFKFEDFCDANEFIKSDSWEDVVEELDEQIRTGFRG